MGKGVGELTGMLSGVPYLGEVGGAVGIGAGFLYSKLEKKGIGKVIEKYRLVSLDKKILPPSIIKRSEKTVAKIKRSRVPSSLEIDINQALKISANVKRFNFE